MNSVNRLAACGHNQSVDEVCFRDSQHADNSGAIWDFADVSRRFCLQSRGSHDDLSSATRPGAVNL